MKKKVLTITLCILALLYLCLGFSYAKYIETQNTLSFSLNIDGTNVPERIEVTKAPNKTAYIHGEAFKSEGMEVTVYYTDGTSAVVTNYDIENGASLTGGQESVTISYTENSVEKETAVPISVGYQITFNANGGQFADDSTSNTIRCLSDGTVLSGSNSYQEPERIGYAFAGWYKNADCTDGNEFDPANVSVNGAVYAKWNLANYTITYDTDGGSAVAVQEYNITTEVTLAAAPTRTGYTFAGWKLDEATGNWSANTYNATEAIGTGKYGDITLVAQWNAIDYAITYNLDGGTVATANPTSYNVESGPITLNNPTKEGYTFLGWTGSNGETPQITVSIPAGSTGDKSYTANWEAEGVAQAIYSADDGSLTFIRDAYIYKANDSFIDQNGLTKTVTAAFTVGNGYFSSKDRRPWHSIRKSIKSVVVKDEISPTNTSYWFDQFYYCESYDLAKLNTSNVTTMEGMFQEASYSVDTISIDLSGWDTSSVEKMCYMFNKFGYGANAVDIVGINNWDVSYVKQMYYMFSACGYYDSDFSLDLSGWVASSVISMDNMFSSCGYYASDFSLDLSDWNISSVTNMTYMFYYAGYKARTFNLSGLSEWDTSSVTSMTGMFQNAGKSASYSLDLSGWDVSKVSSYSNFNAYVTGKIKAPAFGASAATLSTTRPSVSDTSTTATPETTPEATYRNPLTGEILDSQTTRRSYAVVINNLPEALPQHGVNSAPVIYEMLTEGGVTRCLAVYDDISGVGTVGSIRSARTYLVDLAQAYDAILVHAGASSYGANAINSTGISHLDALGDTGNYFYRDQSRLDAGVAYEHTLFSTGSSIAAYSDELGITRYRDNIDYGLQFADTVNLDGSIASYINIQFSGIKNTSLAYSEAQGLYYAYQNGGSYVDGNSGSAVTFKNVLILRSETYDNGERLSMNLTGSGDGYFACNGQMVQIRWHRNSASDPFSYTLTDGTPITLSVGNSYIAIVPLDASVTIS